MDQQKFISLYSSLIFAHIAFNCVMLWLNTVFVA